MRTPQTAPAPGRPGWHAFDRARRPACTRPDAASPGHSAPWSGNGRHLGWRNSRDKVEGRTRRKGAGNGIRKREGFHVKLINLS
jgi:hypothetical protein